MKGPGGDARKKPVQEEKPSSLEKGATQGGKKEDNEEGKWREIID